MTFSQTGKTQSCLSYKLEPFSNCRVIQLDRQVLTDPYWALPCSVHRVELIPFLPRLHPLGSLLVFHISLWMSGTSVFCPLDVGHFRVLPLVHRVELIPFLPRLLPQGSLLVFLKFDLDPFPHKVTYVLKCGNPASISDIPFHLSTRLSGRRMTIPLKLS